MRNRRDTVILVLGVVAIGGGVAYWKATERPTTEEVARDVERRVRTLLDVTESRVERGSGNFWRVTVNAKLDACEKARGRLPSNPEADCVAVRCATDVVLFDVVSYKGKWERTGSMQFRGCMK
jgi:hypothetical protein